MSIDNIKKLTRIFLYVFILTFTLLVTNTVSAEETVVVGQVYNKTDNSPIAQVNVVFKNTTKGTKTNDEGYFLIRNSSKETTLVFSSIGYKSQEIRVKHGQSVGLEVKLEEQNTLLQELFITPGSNPALDWMKKIRLLKKINDVTKNSQFKSQSTEQNLILLNKINQQNISKRIFKQLKNGSLSKADSVLTVPLYMTECKYQIVSGSKKEISKRVFSSTTKSENILELLTAQTIENINFYDNAITIFGKNMISPLSNMGFSFYNYYLADSINSDFGKQYEIHFISKNTKNLAFNGRFLFDSATLALTKIEAELPSTANINFIRNLHISQKFEHLPSNQWTRKNEELALNMNYELLGDSINSRPEIFIKRSTSYNYSDSLINSTNNFAQSNYDQNTLDEKLIAMNNTPVLRTAKWLADIIFTGYIPMGKIDIGKIQNLARLTEIEGLRINLPLKTNQNLWKNISIGGYAGYCTKTNEIKYSSSNKFRLPGEKRRIVGITYTNDYRTINFDYNNFIYHENPLVTADKDIANTIIGFHYGNRMNLRKEFAVSFSNDWNSDIESNLYIRSNQLFGNADLPMTNGNAVLSSVIQQSATIETRFSFGERTYEDHLQRIYIGNNKPILYSVFEFGKYKMGVTTGNYGKASAAIKQNIRLDFGQFNYVAEAGCVIGKVPYTLLQIPLGSNTGGYGFYSFNLMQLMEFANDKYINLHSELTLNGLILNQIPLVKKLNLREICSFKMMYGSLSNSHESILNFPSYLGPLSKPYMEVGVGITNILHLFTFQSVWRLNDLDKQGVIPWKIMGSLNLSF
jgi:hypothetical protein